MSWVSRAGQQCDWAMPRALEHLFISLQISNCKSSGQTKRQCRRRGRCPIASNRLAIEAFINITTSSKAAPRPAWPKASWPPYPVPSCHLLTPHVSHRSDITSPLCSTEAQPTTTKLTRSLAAARIMAWQFSSTNLAIRGSACSRRTSVN